MRLTNKRHRLLLTWTLRCGSVSLVLIAVAFATRHGTEQAVLPGDDVEGLTAVLDREFNGDGAPIRFRDVTEDLGIAFRHFPDRRASLLPEDMGSGVACGDFDGDGFTDVFLVNFAGSILKPLDGGDAQRSRLYRNVDGKRFEDVTDAAGIDFAGYGMGAAWGDYDNDGRPDLYITAFGGNVLYRNVGTPGAPRFQDVTDAAGVQDTRFSSGCAWADYNRDGRLDLYVCNYVEFVHRPEDRDRTRRQYATEQPYTLNPSAYEPQTNALFRNNGDGTFSRVAEAAGVSDPGGRSLTVTWSDLNNDGWPDLYIANDVSKNGVFLNRRDGTFQNVGPSSLAGDYRGAMGIAPADFDDDLDLDLLVTHWIAQENALFRNMTTDAFLESSDAESGARFWFMDEADQQGLGQVSLDMVGWATAFTDFDNDGRRDLWVVNGSTLEDTDDHTRLVPQTPLLFWNHPERGFVEIAGQTNPLLARPMVGRGGATLDYDRDGRMDLIVLVLGGDAFILRNVSEPAGNSLRIRVRQTGGNTDAIGTRVYVTTAGRTRMAEVRAGSSYLSQNEPTLHFGCGQDATVDALRIVWPDGTEESHHDIALPSVQAFTHEARYPVSLTSELGDEHARVSLAQRDLHGMSPTTQPAEPRTQGKTP